MAEDGLQKMAAICNELIEYAKKLEVENAKLQEQCKTASAQVPAVPDECAAQTCAALLDAGLITADQVEQTKQAFLEDPTAAHRTIVGILDAQAQTKEAAAEPVNLDGGTVVKGQSQQGDVYEESMKRIQAILGIR